MIERVSLSREVDFDGGVPSPSSRHAGRAKLFGKPEHNGPVTSLTEIMYGDNCAGTEGEGVGERRGPLWMSFWIELFVRR